MDKNKVQFNLKNVHYSVLSFTEGKPTWAVPVAVPGAVTLTLDPQGSVEPFYADGIVYYQAIANNGYSGDLEMARYPDKMLTDVWGFELDDTNKVLTENANVLNIAKLNRKQTQSYNFKKTFIMTIFCL